ncbi:MAG: cytochrome c3 family protein [Bacteroidales bacterium]|jgi:hypothetical protein|nr:cytochrome c3 family protein [Bacteroidales bacterium]
MKSYILFTISLLLTISAYGQISPGDLSAPHAHLEGVANCTQCHVLGESVTNEKCLACHTEVDNRMKANKGYHVSADVKGKRCVECHNDHHGRDYELIILDESSFDHQTTGFILEGKHNTIDCDDCHKDEFIVDKEIKEKDRTFLGLSSSCLSCHEDYHRETLSDDCMTCHDFNHFAPAPKFNHEDTDFKLLGKHQKVECIECHKKEHINGDDFQHFSNVAHQACTDCHEDVHDNKFGQNCTQCHTHNSFREIKGMDGFDHSQTAYPLEGKHATVECKECHKGAYTEPLAHDRCSACHEDEHKGQFTQKNPSSDCQDCHSVASFQRSTFSIERHNKTAYKLDGAHLATPCFSCHKKGDEWEFTHLATRCVDCHDNEHEGHMSASYTADDGCAKCHTVAHWENVNFDHSQTSFELEGVHAETACAACHYPKNEQHISTQQFASLTGDCSQCHEDEHRGQFDKYKEEGCTKCHGFKDWKINDFNHDECRFPLEGEHRDVACNDCHTIEISENESFRTYLFNDIQCATCHK